MVRRHVKVFRSALLLAGATSCSIYDSALLAESRGGKAALGEDANGSGGASESSGGANGAGGDSDGGNEGSGGHEQNGGMGGDASGGDGTGGDASGGDGTGGSCPMEDCCPEDPEKTDPGECGCGEVDIDSDGDLTADCNDLCPNEPSKTEPGECGCEVPASEEEECSALKNGILHRYEFSGTGTEATDSVGDKDGTIVGGLQSDGTLTLDGIDQYVSLPAGMVSSLTDATFEVWFTWNGGDGYQRIFDFGDTTGSPTLGNTYLYLAASRPEEGPGSGFSLTGYSAEIKTEAPNVLVLGEKYHIVLVTSETNGSFSLYIDGAFQSGIAFTSSLGALSDINCYLGRSLYDADPYLNGSIDEFRIYDVALNQAEIAFSLAQGPDTTLFD